MIEQREIYEIVVEDMEVWAQRLCVTWEGRGLGGGRRAPASLLRLGPGLGCRLGPLARRGAGGRRRLEKNISNKSIALFLFKKSWASAYLRARGGLDGAPGSPHALGGVGEGEGGVGRARGGGEGGGRARLFLLHTAARTGAGVLGGQKIINKTNPKD